MNTINNDKAKLLIKPSLIKIDWAIYFAGHSIYGDWWDNNSEKVNKILYDNLHTYRESKNNDPVFKKLELVIYQLSQALFDGRLSSYLLIEVEDYYLNRTKFKIDQSSWYYSFLWKLIFYDKDKEKLEKPLIAQMQVQTDEEFEGQLSEVGEIEFCNVYLLANELEAQGIEIDYLAIIQDELEIKPKMKTDPFSNQEIKKITELLQILFEEELQKEASEIRIFTFNEVAEIITVKYPELKGRINLSRLNRLDVWKKRNERLKTARARNPAK